MRHPLLRASALGLTLVLLVAAGCSSDDGDSNVEREQPDDEQPEAEPADAAAPDTPNRIVAENEKPGNPEWVIEDGDLRPRPIEGFTDRVSGQQGESVQLFATTEAETFEVVAYRLGYYQGVGAREVWTSGPQPGVAQPECATHPDTRMVDCSNWSPSMTVDIDDAWTPGQYLLKLVLPDDSDTYVPFIVRDDDHHSDVLVVSGVTTRQAYNSWGGYSLYDAAAGMPGDRADVVSFDRPNDMYWGQAGILGDTANVGTMLESMGLDVSYTTNIDQHERPELMQNHRVIVSNSHDEYYSLEMRDGLEAARDNGTNIMFLGANAVYRRIRLEPSPLGPNRHQVNYRSAADDPLAGVDPERVTTSWRDEPAARPESDLTGTVYECNEGGMAADMVIVDAVDWMFEGTGVTEGHRWPEVVVEEYDRVTPELPTPENIQVVARSPLTCRGNQSYSDMSYYTAPDGGGGVLSVGTLGFEGRLGPLCAPEELAAGAWECQLRQMVANVVQEFAQGPASLTHPSEPNLDRLSSG